MKKERVRILKKAKEKPGPIVYWMSRDQRAHDNWVLFFAQELAFKQRIPLAVVFCLVPQFLGATIRQYGFMLQSLQETEKKLKQEIFLFFYLRDPLKKKFLSLQQNTELALLSPTLTRCA